MSWFRSQRGEGKAGCVFWLLILLLGILVAYRIIPAQISHAKLTDYMEELAKFYPRKEGKWFKESIMNKAKDLEIPLEAQNVQIDKTAQRIKMRVHYTVPMSFFVWTYEKSYDINMDRDIFIIR